jgi:hypothetical protein
MENTYKKITEEMRLQLRKPLPKEAVSAHPTKKYMSSIKAIYVVERLNDVFGIGEWDIANEVITVSGKMVVVKSVFTIKGYAIRVEQFGGNDNADLGDAYKGAATDALTKIGSYLEIGIDVFKGLNDRIESKSSVKEDERPWLKEGQLKKIIERIKNGEPELKETAIKQFKMKAEYKQLIQAA